MALQVRDATEGTSRAARRRRAELEDQRALQYEWLRQQRVERAARQQQLFLEQQQQAQVQQARAPVKEHRVGAGRELGQGRQKQQHSQQQQAPVPSLLDLPDAPLWSTVAATNTQPAANRIGPKPQRPKRNKASRKASQDATAEPSPAPAPPAKQVTVASTSKGESDRSDVVEQVKNFADVMQTVNPNLPIASILDGLTKVIGLLTENPTAAIAEIFKLLTSLISPNVQTK